MKILLVYPQSPDTFWSFKHLLRFVSRRVAFPPLGLLTIAAMLPRDWQFKLVDLNVERLRDEDLRWADYVMISAMLVHRASVEEIVARCGAMGKPMIAGGPLFTTGHEAFPEAPHFVLGEADDIMPEVVADTCEQTLEFVFCSDFSGHGEIPRGCCQRAVKTGHFESGIADRAKGPDLNLNSDGQPSRSLSQLMKRRFGYSWATALCLGALLMALPVSVRSQSNLVWDGSFELWGERWVGALPLYMDQGAPGRTHACHGSGLCPSGFGNYS